MTLLLGAESLAAQQMLTDTDVIRMVQAGVAPDLIVKLIETSASRFAAGPDQLIGWKKAGIPDSVMRSMLARAANSPMLQYVHFSSEVRVIPKRGGHRWLRLKIR